MKKLYYSISEVCNLLDLKPHIIRYWESEFPSLKPSRTKGATRRYTAEKIELLRKVRDMLYVQKFTVKGVKKKLSHMNTMEKYDNTTVNKGLINDQLKESIIKELTQIKDNLDSIVHDE